MSHHDRDDFEEARDLLQRTTEFLTDCAQYADSPVASREIHELIDGLRRVGEGSREDAPLPASERRAGAHGRDWREKRSA